MPTNALSFGQQAATYAAGRPRYPDGLFDWIAANSPAHDRVWDVATGSGQAAVSLAERFARVHATDVSAGQIAAAAPHPAITYTVGPAERSGLPDNSVDAVTVATALHWFGHAAFWDEVARVSRPGALFAAWCYRLPQSTPEVHRALLDPLFAVIDPYWAPGNRLAMAGYSADALHCPRPVLDMPEFDAGGVWTLDALVAFARSWSAHHRAREAGHAEKIAAIEARARKALGDRAIAVSLPLTTLACRVG